MRGESSDPSKDVVPRLLNQILGAAWIALFSGRWICIPLLLAFRLIPSSLVADLDDSVLFRLYLILVAITILVVALRLLRRATERSTMDASQQSNRTGTLGMAEGRMPTDGKQEADSL